MKNIVILAIFMAAVMGVMAQSPTISKMEQPVDSVSIMFQSLQRTNAEIVRLNRAYTAHAMMVGMGGAFELAGAAMIFWAPSESTKKIGMLTSVVGIGMIALSYLPMPKGVHVDERGFVVDLPSKKKK